MANQKVNKIISDGWKLLKINFNFLSRHKLNRNIMKTDPNYKKIYRDIIFKHYPDKHAVCESILKKNTLSALDVIKLNNIIFETKDKQILIFNQKHRAYNKLDILEILKYQRKNGLNNTQLANQFKISRNTITKWKKNI